MAWRTEGRSCNTVMYLGVRECTSRATILFLRRILYIGIYTVCPTRYRTRHFFNNSNTNKDTATKLEQEYIRCLRNVSVVCVYSAPNCCDTEQRYASQLACFLLDAPLC